MNDTQIQLDMIKKKTHTITEMYNPISQLANPSG